MSMLIQYVKLTWAVVVLTIVGQVAYGQGTSNQLVLGAFHSSRYGSAADISLEGRDIANTGIDADLNLKVGDAGREHSFNIGRNFQLGRGFDKNAGIAVDLFALERDWDDDVFSFQSAGIELAYGAHWTPEVRYAIGVFFREDEVDDFEVDTSRIITQDEGKSRAAGVLAHVARDTYQLNGAIALGSKIKTSAQVSLLDQDRNFTKLSFDAQTTQHLAANVFYDLNFSLGQVSGNGGDGVQVIDRAFSAVTPIRGFAYAGYTPRDLTTDDALGGQKYASISAEAIMPLGHRGVSIGAFVDAGSIWDLSDLDAPGIDDSFALRSSVGLSLRWALKNGQIGVAIAEPIDFQTGDEFQVLSVTLGAKF